MASSRSTQINRIVCTKLKRPEAPADLVSRPRLLKLLDANPDRSLTLVSAPAGYGKSTLVASWLDTMDLPNAWLSLDENDDDIRQFLMYFIAAVEAVLGPVCNQSKELLEASTLPPAAVLAGHLANDLGAIEQPFALVLDDYHRIRQTVIHDVLRRLLRHPPSALHLVLVTRRDPPLGLAGLRAGSRLVEIREEDLRFSREETQLALRRIAGISVTGETLSSVDTEIEGWIVGLRLLCLALRNQSDPDTYLGSLHGGNQSIQQYLLEEVLQQQPPAFQQCLLKTSLLDRFCASLCEALCGKPVDGNAFLRDLADANLFAIRLDERGEWMRYHHLFQQLLQRQLRRETRDDDIAALHGRAGDWFESEHFLEEAMDHALRGGHHEKAAELVERSRVDLLNDDRWYVLEDWFRRIPETVRETRPALLLADAWSAYERFQFDRLALVVEKVASLVDPDTSHPSVLGELALLQGNLYYWSGEGALSRRYLEEARTHLPERRGIVRGLLELLYHLALSMDGDADRAVKDLDALIGEAGSLEGIYLSRLVAGLYFVHHFRGNLLRARVEGERLHVVATRSDIVYTDAWSSYMQACSYFHANDLEQALKHFEAAVRHRYILHSRGAIDAVAGLAITQQFLGQREAASATTDMMQAFALELGHAQYVAVALSCRARVALLRGDLASALAWARSAEEVVVPAGLFMWLEVPAITRARVWIADGTAPNVERAISLLDEVRSQSEKCCYVNQAIEAAVLRTLAEEDSNALAEAVTMAMEGGWIRPFVEAGPSMADLLEQRMEEGPGARFVGKILGAFPAKGTKSKTGGPGPGLDSPLIEPLTNRELDVLGLLAQRLYDKEIAERLSISLATVKTHVKHIYGKLDVSGRRQAVAKAAELGLLGK